jgi:hypothetical protein
MSIVKYKVVQIWPGLFVCKQVTVCPGHIWTTLYVYINLMEQSCSWEANINSFMIFPIIYGTCTLHSVYKTLSLELILSHSNPVHIPTAYLFILPYIRLSRTTIENIQIWHVFYICCMPDHLILIWSFIIFSIQYSFWSFKLSHVFWPPARLCLLGLNNHLRFWTPLFLYDSREISHPLKN